MIDEILKTEELCNILRGVCEDNNIGTLICEELLIDDGIDDERVAILKVDKYYNTRDFAIPPKSIDCLIVLKHFNSDFSLYLIELKNVKNLGGSIKASDIKSKFKTTIDQFMSIDFQDIFLSKQYNILRLNLFLVTDPFKKANLTDEQYQKKIKSTVLDKMQSIKPFKFRQQIAQIVHKRPPVTVCL